MNDIGSGLPKPKPSLAIQAKTGKQKTGGKEKTINKNHEGIDKRKVSIPSAFSGAVAHSKAQAWMHDKTDALDQGDLTIDDVASGKKTNTKEANATKISLEKTEKSSGGSERDEQEDQNMDFESIETELKSQDEEQLKKELTEALQDLDEKDMKVLNSLRVSSSVPKRLRLIRYLFIPSLVLDIFKAWNNAASIKKLKRVAAIYDKYHSAIKSQVETKIDSKLIKYALSKEGLKFTQEDKSKSNLKSLIILEIRNFDKIVFPENKKLKPDEKAEQVSSRLISDHISSRQNLDYLADNVAASYIDKQLADQHGAFKFSARLNAARTFAEMSKEKSLDPFTSSNLFSESKGQKELRENLTQVGKDFQEKSINLGTKLGSALVTELADFSKKSTDKLAGSSQALVQDLNESKIAG